MPIYPGRRKGTWRVGLWVRGVGQREWIFEGTKRGARDFETVKRSEVCGPSKAGARAVPTLLDFITQVYEPHAKAHLRGSTWKRSRRYILSILTRQLGGCRLNEISGAPVEAFKLARLEQGVKPSSINAGLQALRTVLRWARDEMGIPVGEVRIRRMRVDDRRVFVWSGEDVARLYGTARRRHPALVPLLEFMLNTGVRKGEAIAAEWSWVDWDARLLRIPVTDHWRPKSGRSRDVPIDGILPLLRALPRDKHPEIFRSKWGLPFAQFPDMPFRACVKAAAMKGGPHTCRHTYASHFLQAVPDLGLLAEVLGHTSTRVTALYAHLLPGHLERARGAVNLRPPGSRPLAAALATAGETPKKKRARAI